MLIDIQIIVFLLFIMASCQVAGLITRRPTEDRVLMAVILSPVIVFVIVLVLSMMFSSSMM